MELTNKINGLLGERKGEVFVTNLNCFSSHIFFIFKIKVLETLTILIFAVQLHSLRCVGQLVELLILVLHLLVPLPQLEIWSPRGNLIHRLSNAVNLSLVNTEIQVIVRQMTIFY